MFGRKRKEIRKHNEQVLHSFAGFKLYSILREMDERLQAANPNYRINSLAVALYRDGKDAELWVELQTQDWLDEQDRQIATAIIESAEMEIREQYGR